MFYVKKFSGEIEQFNEIKVRKSLEKCNVDEKLIDHIIENIKIAKPTSTKQIHHLITIILHKHAPHLASRYNLKKALFQLGPTGYPFEQFIGQLFAAQNYTIQVGIIIPGLCVEHEVDVTAQKEEKHFMIECKFHNRQGTKTDVQIILYTYARFLDLRGAWEKNATHSQEFHQAWVVTNTKLTKQAIDYGMCKEMKLIGWRELAPAIDKLAFYPITSLLSLKKWQKKELIDNDIVLCRQISENKEFLEKIGISGHEIKNLLQQCDALCKTEIND